MGEGSFGVVNKGRLDGTDVAIKKLKTGNSLTDKELKAFEDEALLMLYEHYHSHFFLKKFHRKIPAHPNIVMFRGVTLDPLCIIVDYCDGGSLHNFLKSNATIDTKLMIKFTTEIARGMVHLHTRLEQELIHRDLYVLF